MSSDIRSLPSAFRASRFQWLQLCTSWWFPPCVVFLLVCTYITLNACNSKLILGIYVTILREHPRHTLCSLFLAGQNKIRVFLPIMLMYGKEASNRKQEIDRQHYTIPNQRPKDKHCGKI